MFRFLFPETDADSCQYYKDHLSATLDGIFFIYPKDTEIKKRVFCKGISGTQPAYEYPFEELGRLNKWILMQTRKLSRWPEQKD